jgi:hypothetical protein
MKPIHPWLRNVFITGCLLSLIAGVQLFVFTTRTELYFAWTIKSALTAATLGAFYFGTMTFGGLSARETRWASVQAPTVGLFAFLWLTGLATALHLENFHLASPNPFTRFVTVIWLLIYTLVPIGLVLALIQQRRLTGLAETVATLPLSPGLRSVLSLHGGAGLLFGALLLLTPQAILPFWGWALTPLAARALAAWLIAYGLMDGVLLLQNDRAACKVPAAGYLVSSGMAFMALFRYAPDMNWSSAGGLGYLIFLACMLGLGLASMTGRLR